jgi:hypothetical protein
MAAELAKGDYANERTERENKAKTGGVNAVDSGKL